MTTAATKGPRRLASRVIGALSPSELTALLQRCTPFEQEAVDQYRGRLSGLHRARRAGRATSEQAVRRWTSALHQLEAEANGTPGFDRFVASQFERRDQWCSEHLSEEATRKESA